VAARHRRRIVAFVFLFRDTADVTAVDVINRSVGGSFVACGLIAWHYFVASEALANVAKYAHATAVSMRVRRNGRMASIEIADDGVGGADDTAGSGLRGLADRVEALDGHLRVASPAGAGTVITAELPCGS
jgi:signal transduction histidine kinase